MTTFLKITKKLYWLGFAWTDRDFFSYSGTEIILSVFSPLYR